MPERKRNNWFRNYQEIPELSIEGSHKLAGRIMYYNQDEFKGASVLDIGCNIGQMSIQAKRWGAGRVLGVEYDNVAHAKAVENNKKLGLDINFVLDDIDNPFFWNSIGHFDICLFLSIMDTTELTNRYAVLSKASMKTDKAMYFEGHPESINPSNKYMKDLIFHTDFTDIVYKGQRLDRPFIKATRKVMNSQEFIESVKTTKYSKIAVVGKPLAGKTTLRKVLEEAGQVRHKIVDDLWTKDGCLGFGITNAKDIANVVPNIILFDHYALEYIQYADVVYFLTQPEEKTGILKPAAGPLRSPTANFGSIKEFHTVLMK